MSRDVMCGQRLEFKLLAVDPEATLPSLGYSLVSFTITKFQARCTSAEMHPPARRGDSPVCNSGRHKSCCMPVPQKGQL